MGGEAGDKFAPLLNFNGLVDFHLRHAKAQGLGCHNFARRMNGE
jgi:hypothetical protein